MDIEKVSKAVEVVRSGVADKVCIDNCTIYRCGTIIRIDIKD